MPSNSTELFGLIAFFAFAALVIHSLWQASKRVPPATDRLPAGVDGALLAVAGLAFLAGIYDAAAAALAYQQIGEGGAWAADLARNVHISNKSAIGHARERAPDGKLKVAPDKAKRQIKSLSFAFEILGELSDGSRQKRRLPRREFDRQLSEDSVHDCAVMPAVGPVDKEEGIVKRRENERAAGRRPLKRFGSQRLCLFLHAFHY